MSDFSSKNCDIPTSIQQLETSWVDDFFHAHVKFLKSKVTESNTSWKEWKIFKQQISEIQCLNEMYKTKKHLILAKNTDIREKFESIFGLLKSWDDIEKVRREIEKEINDKLDKLEAHQKPSSSWEEKISPEAAKKLNKEYLGVYKIPFTRWEKASIRKIYTEHRESFVKFLGSSRRYNAAFRAAKKQKYKYWSNFSSRIYPYYARALNNNSLPPVIKDFSHAQELEKKELLARLDIHNSLWILDTSIVVKSKIKGQKWLLYATPEAKETITEIIQEFQKWVREVFGQDAHARVFLNSLLRPASYKIRGSSIYSPHMRWIWVDFWHYDFEFSKGWKKTIITTSRGRKNMNDARKRVLWTTPNVKIDKNRVTELKAILYRVLYEFDKKGRIIFTREWTHPHVTITPDTNKQKQPQKQVLPDTKKIKKANLQKRVSPEGRNNFTQKYEQLQEKYKQTSFTALGNAQIQWFFTMLDDPDVDNKQHILSAIQWVMEEQETLINDSAKKQEMSEFFFSLYTIPSKLNKYQKIFLRHAMISFYDGKIDWIAQAYNRFYRDIPKWKNKTSFLKQNKIHPLEEMKKTIDPREKKIYQQYDWYHVFVQALDTMRLLPKSKKQFLDTLDEYFKVEMDIVWNNAFIDTIWDCIHAPNYHIAKLSQTLKETIKNHTSLLDKQKRKYKKEFFGDRPIAKELDIFLWEFTIQAKNFEYRMSSQSQSDTYDRDSILYYTFSHLYRTNNTDVDTIKKLLKKNNINVSKALSTSFTPKDKKTYIDYKLHEDVANLKRLHAEWKVTTRQIWETLGGWVGFQVYRNNEMWLSNAIDMFGLPDTLIDSIRKILGRKKLTSSQIKNIEKMLQYFLFIESNSNRWYRTKWWYNVANYAQISSAKWYLQYLHRNGKYRRRKWLTNSFETALRRVDQAGMMDKYPNLFSMYAASWTFQKKGIKESVKSFEDRVQRVQNPMFLSAEEQMVLFFCDIVWKRGGKQILEKIVDGDSKQVIKMYAKLHHTDERERETQKLAQEAHTAVYQ